MKQFNCSRMRLMIVGFTVVIVLGGNITKADFTFGEPVNLGPNVNSTSGEIGPSISADGLEFYFSSNRPGGYGGFDLWVMKRPTIEDEWGAPMNLGSPANSQYSYWEPSISSDNLTLYFSGAHSGTYGTPLPGGLGGQGDIWMLTRETVHDDWSEPVNIGAAVNSQHAIHPSISADGQSLYFQSHRPGRLGAHCDIMVATREATSESFGAPVFMENINSSIGEWTPDISNDGRMLFFSRVVVAGSVMEIWAATRKTTGDDFGRPTKLPPQVNVPSRLNLSPNSSADGSTLYFASNRPGGVGSYDLWQVSIIPIADFNGDGVVDLDDMVILIDVWGMDEPLCDIGPMPWGDGVVNIEDLKVFMSYWGQEFDDPMLIAHWKLDETEGAMANDSAGEIQAELYGDPVWRPTDGMIDGALMLDGIDDFVGTWNIPGLSTGKLSVFAWIKGGAPGQVAVSQFRGVNWLMADAGGGYLRTDLGAHPLVSEVTITDGNWHRVGITWDGTNRVLYVDDAEAASDTQANLGRSDIGLNIGCGPDETSGTFFWGLIDDVRIYNRAVKP